MYEIAAKRKFLLLTVQYKNLSQILPKLTTVIYSLSLKIKFLMILKFKIPMNKYL